MQRLNPILRWKNLSVSKKLYGVVGLMAVLVASELFTLLFAMNTLSAVRAFVAGEGLWSKAQKNALLELQKYVYSGDESHYQAFRENLKVNFGDRKARIEMSKPKMNVAVVTEGFVEGGNHPSDVPSMIRLMRKFSWIGYIRESIEVWGEADAVLNNLDELGKEIHQVIRSPETLRKSTRLRKLSARLTVINLQLTVLEDRFSYTLGEASRWLESWLRMLLLIAVFLVEGTGLFLTITFTRGLSRMLQELNLAASAVGKGDFGQVVPVRSKDELGRLAHAINRMTRNLRTANQERAHANEANEVKSLFLANMSHEIRTPLGAILGFVELLRDEDLTAREKTKYLDVIQRTGESLAHIINDILDISKVEAGKLEINTSRCSLEKIMKDLSLLLSLRCEHKGIYLRMVPKENLPTYVYTDGSRLRQILLNVIGNAIKFTDRGGIEITYGVNGALLEFRVMDTGIGISSAETEKLFRPFSQVDLSLRKKHGGTGLGLALSRKLAEHLGGTVFLAHSEAGQGSTFVVQVKPERMESMAITAKAANKSPSLAGALKGKRILLIEDNPDNQLLIARMLFKAGAKIETANNGREGVDRALAEEFDLLLMDMQMPVMDGLSATTELRERGYTKPIIALTAHAMREDIDKTLSVGCNAVLTKPLKAAELIETAAQFLSDVGGDAA